MLCDNCKKREATQKIVSKINGKVTEIYLCDVCSKEFASFEDVGIDSYNMDDFATLTNLFNNVFAPFSMNASQTQKEITVCTSCGTTFEEFSKTSFLGCSKCYDHFREQLKPLLRRMYSKTQHIGKMPKKVENKLSDTDTIERLKEKLREVIEKEDYEAAAVIRDKIKELQKRSS